MLKKKFIKHWFTGLCGLLVIFLLVFGYQPVLASDDVSTTPQDTLVLPSGNGITGSGTFSVVAGTSIVIGDVSITAKENSVLVFNQQGDQKAVKPKSQKKSGKEKPVRKVAVAQTKSVPDKGKDGLYIPWDNPLPAGAPNQPTLVFSAGSGSSVSFQYFSCEIIQTHYDNPLPCAQVFAALLNLGINESHKPHSGRAPPLRISC
jgi:hypothetical protein